MTRLSAIQPQFGTLDLKLARRDGHLLRCRFVNDGKTDIRVAYSDDVYNTVAHSDELATLQVNALNKLGKKIASALQSVTFDNQLAASETQKLTGWLTGIRQRLSGANKVHLKQAGYQFALT